jgi:hypothetical protein
MEGRGGGEAQGVAGQKSKKAKKNLNRGQFFTERLGANFVPRFQLRATLARRKFFSQA